MDIMNLLKQVKNVSTLLVLPIFSDINLRYSRFLADSNYPFLQLFLNNGGKNTYLDPDNMTLTLELDYDESTFVISPVSSIEVDLLTILATHPNCVQMFKFDSKVILKFSIPSEFTEDIQKISESKYSKVSDAYKQALKSKATSVAHIGDSTAALLSEYDLGYHICKKSEGLSDLLSESLGVQFSEDMELFSKFNREKETFDYGKMFSVHQT